MKFLEIIIVESDVRKAIYYAPFASGIKKGDLVTIDEAKTCAVEVKECFTVSTESDLYKFVMALCTRIGRLTGKVEKLDYSDEDYIQGIE